MDTNATRIGVREVVTEIVGRPVSDAEPIVSSGLIDSLSVLRLIAGLEQRLQIAIRPDNLQPDDFDTVDLILDLLQREAR